VSKQSIGGNDLVERRMSGEVQVAIDVEDGDEARAAIGFILIASERTIEREMQLLAPDGVGVHFTRVPIANEVTVDSLSPIGDELTRAAATLLPDGVIDVITYACTSGSLILGEERVQRQILAAAPGVKASSLISGVVRALRALDIRRVALGTPYLEEINTLETQYLKERGFDVRCHLGLQLRYDLDMSRVSLATIKRLAHKVDSPDADAVFISCGALRSIHVIDELEEELGKPVVTSNQAMMWDVLGLAGIDDPIPGYGRLLREPRVSASSKS
jgi:maleate isomerase